MFYKIEPPYTERYVRWCEGTVNKLIIYLLLDKFTDGKEILCPCLLFQGRNEQNESVSGRVKEKHGRKREEKIFTVHQFIMTDSKVKIF